MGIELDAGHYLLALIVVCQYATAWINSVLWRNDRKDLTKRIMARSLAEYNEGQLFEDRLKRGEPTPEEEQAIYERHSYPVGN